MIRIKHLYLLLIFHVATLALSGCSPGIAFSEIRSGGVKRLGPDAYYVNTESDYAGIVEGSKVAFNLASAECYQRSKDLLIISQQSNRFSEVQLIFKCISVDETKYQKLPSYKNDQNVKMGVSTNDQAQQDRITGASNEYISQPFPVL
jgi:osmotically-inducible protein OsmY